MKKPSVSEKEENFKDARILPNLILPSEAAKVLRRSTATLKRWRYEGVGPDWRKLNGRISYDVEGLADFIRQGKRVPSVRAAKEKTRDAV